MKLYKKIWFLICVMLFVFSFASISYALTPMDQVEFKTFTDGPWEGLRYGAVRYDSKGNVKQETLEWEGTIVVPTSREGSYSQVGAVTNGAYEPTAYFFSDDQVNNVVIFSFGPLSELYVIDKDGNIIADVKDDAFLCNPSGTRSLYGVSLQGGTGIAVSSFHGFTLSEFSPNYFGGNYYDDVVDSLPYLGGIYDSNSIGIRYPGLILSAITPYRLTYGYNYLYFPVVCLGQGDAGDNFSFLFNSTDGLLHEGSLYSFNFRCYNVGSLWMEYNSIYGTTEWLPDNVINIKINGSEFPLSALGLHLGRYADSPDGFCLIYKSSSSDDIGTIPPDDPEGGEGGSSSPDYSSALAKIGDILSDVSASVSSSGQQIVNNITYQTTQITNTITNTVTNMTQQITQGLQSVQQGITDKLGTVQDGITNKLQDVQQGVTDKLQNVQDGINDKLGEVQDEIVNGYDNSGIESENDELSGAVDELDQAEKEVLDDVTGYIEGFEYPSFDSLSGGLLGAISFFGGYLQSMFLAMGDFGLIITFSLTMIFVLIIVGYHRIRT